MSIHNVRSVLEYVPYFRGRLFVIHLSAKLLAAREIIDALLDIDALHEIGVRLVLVAEGGESSQHRLLEKAMECELHAALAEPYLSEDADLTLARVREIIARNQIALVTSGTEGRFVEEIVELCCALKARKYICIQDGGVPTREGQPIFSILESEVAQAYDCSYREDLLEAAMVCRRGIPRVHLLDGRHRGVLLDELFSEEGVGTMVHADSYREIRAMQLDDIPELLSMISRSMAGAKLINRSYESVLDFLDSYYVYTLDDTIVGCVAIYPYPEHECAELGCLFIKRNYEGHGYGRALCAMVEEKARDMGFKHLFAVSQSAVEYFRDTLGYSTIPHAKLPPERLKLLERSGRSSLAFGRDL